MFKANSKFDNTYARLPGRFYARVNATAAPAPELLKVNAALAETLGIDPAWLSGPEGVQMLAGNVVPEGAEPIALAYAGHQFGSFVRQLGDGRALLLGEVVGVDGVRRDIQLKGAGRTPFSRGGDGRAALGPVLREYVVSEAMAALGIPTTRALAAVTTGDRVVRERALPGAILARVASSHIRVGTFEFFAAQNDLEALSALATYALERHYPHATGSGNDPLALFDQVMAAQAGLCARWLGVGFVHGVMNTDNTSISGETIDYGPCAFLDEYDPKKTFSSIDHGGRYAFANQPRIAQWNLLRLAETLLAIMPGDPDLAAQSLTDSLNRYPSLFEAAYGRVLRAKMGLGEAREGDDELMADILARLAVSGLDYTIFFRSLCDAADDPSGEADKKIAASFVDPGAFHEWAERWRRRFSEDGTEAEERVLAMRRANPAFIPRNHRIEEMIEAAVLENDLEPFEVLLRVLQRPYDDQPEYAEYAEPPRPEERVRATFCGT